MPQFKVTWDRDVDAAYILFLSTIDEGASVKQVPCDPDEGGTLARVVLDFDKDDKLLGIEVLDASHLLSPDLLAQAEQHS